MVGAGVAATPRRGGLPFGRWRGASSLRMDWLALALHRASLPLGAVVGGSLQVVVMCRL